MPEWIVQAPAATATTPQWILVKPASNASNILVLYLHRNTRSSPASMDGPQDTEPKPSTQRNLDGSRGQNFTTDNPPSSDQPLDAENQELHKPQQQVSVIY